MPFFQSLIKGRVEPRKTTKDDGVNNPTYPRTGKGRSGQSSARPRLVTFTSQSAACRGLYATPTRRSANQQRSTTRASDGARVHVDNDPIIKCSIYPQMVGRRKSELQPSTRGRPAKYDRASADFHHDRSATLRGRPVRPQQLLSRMRWSSAESDFSFDSDYSSDGNPEGRPIRVCMYPQAKYIKEPAKAPLNLYRRHAAPYGGYVSSGYSYQDSSFHNFKRSSLPYDEYQILVRRQKMQSARAVMEPHFAHHGFVRSGNVWHGRKQSFTVRNSERQHLSKVNHAVRKALKAGLNIHNENYKLALCQHTDKEYFCELSDVDGVTIPQTIIDEFTRSFIDAQDEAYEPKSTGLPYGKLVQHTWIDDRTRRKTSLRRVDSGVAIGAANKRPELVSRFSWDSCSDDGEGKRKRWTKMKR